MASNRKVLIYQIFTRLYGNKNTTRKENGTIAENGCGKFADISGTVLNQIASMGITHVWFTGIIRHATQTIYTEFGIPRQHPAVVKGRAGSPYAITDYYDVDPDLAVDIPHRMDEFEELVARTHTAGLKVIIDFVPNHVARQYRSICRPTGVKDLGETDLRTISTIAQASVSHLTSTSIMVKQNPISKNPPKLPATTISIMLRRSTTGTRRSS